MSDMACEIHLFTQGQGPLKTTHDLFARAENFLQHGVLLYSIIKEFLNQVPNGYLKEELIQLLERLPFNFKQLKNRLKQVTIGKSATFNKVNQMKICLKNTFKPHSLLEDLTPYFLIFI